MKMKVTEDYKAQVKFVRVLEDQLKAEKLVLRYMSTICAMQEKIENARAASLKATCYSIAR